MNLATSKPQQSACSSAGVVGKGKTTPLSLYECWGPNLGLHGCTASILNHCDISLSLFEHLKNYVSDICGLERWLLQRTRVWVPVSTLSSSLIPSSGLHRNSHITHAHKCAQDQKKIFKKCSTQHHDQINGKQSYREMSLCFRKKEYYRKEQRQWVL